jgi:beta-phosphoglucomutase
VAKSNCIASGLALVFDLDGVIIDSMPMHTDAWRIYLDRLGVDSTDVETRMHGRRNDEIVADFIRTPLSPEEIFGHGAAKEALFREMMRPRLQEHLLPGVVQFLERCNGIPKGVGSNAEPANIDFTLDGAGIRSHFQVIVDGHQVQRPKPAPDVYLRAAELLAVTPGNCIVFEDSPAGIEAACAAGARVVGVQSHSGNLSKVDLAIRDFLDPALEPWLESQRPD